MKLVFSQESSRGNLLKVQTSEIPFEVKEILLIYNVPIGKVRGQHAHRSTSQILILVHGKVQVKATNRFGELNKTLEKPGDWISLPPLTWGEQIFLTNDAILQVLCSEEYQKDDYIIDFSDLEALWHKTLEE